MNPFPKVAVLLCTYNGGKYLHEQLESILNQRYPYIDIYASDDNSGDETLKILAEYEKRWTKGVFKIYRGPQSGFCNNFMSLVFNDSIDADFYCYADQDDIWHPDKLLHSINRIVNLSQDIPILYCSRTCLVNSAGTQIGYSPLFLKPPSFRNALVQSIAGGNTMMLNHAARHLLLQTQSCDFVSHDWWTYIIVSGANGMVIYDEAPYVFYRQHESNLVGGNVELSAKFVRISKLFEGRFTRWNEMNSSSLQKVDHILNADNKEVFDTFLKARKLPFFRRLFFLVKSGVYRQTTLGNIGLFVACFFKKL